MKEYQGKFYARLELFKVALSAFSMKGKVNQLLSHIYPKFYVKLLREKVSEVKDWTEVWCRATTQNLEF